MVLTSTARAKTLGIPVVEILGSSVAHTHYGISQMPDLCSTPAVGTGAEAFRQAGLTPADIDVAQLYDSFTYTVLVTLEDLGFCAKGEGGDFVSGQRTAPGGDFALNTSGGGLSYNHPGMFGMFLMIEAVRQLRGECGDRQVADAEVALVNAMGGYLSSAATAILGGYDLTVIENLFEPPVSPSPDALPFWAAADRHELQLPFCVECERSFSIRAPCARPVARAALNGGRRPAAVWSIRSAFSIRTRCPDSAAPYRSSRRWLNWRRARSS